MTAKKEPTEPTGEKAFSAVDSFIRICHGHTRSCNDIIKIFNAPDGIIRAARSAPSK